ncbi:MAG: hypothetical protein NTW86_15570 [Candidatus Sumerlaeota bacterium]|nr:hypothetical protein [Candidatus Sumerlaeota bacterium]
MATQLDALLAAIDPDRTADDTVRRTNEALDGFPGKGSIAQWDEFQSFLTRLHAHLMKAVLRAGPGFPMDAEMHWHGCREILKKEYGSNGDKAAFEMARTGNQGGLYAVMKALAKGVAAELAGNEVAARVRVWLNGLTFGEQFAAAREYIVKYGRLLPSELTEGGATRLVAGFADVLKEHPRLLQKMRRVGW